MRMVDKALRWLHSFTRPLAEPDGKTDSFWSVVLLLQAPRTYSAVDLRDAAERCFQRKFDGVEDPMYFVVEQKPLSIVKAGADVLQILQAAQPYLAHTPEVLKQLFQPEQKKACLDHFARVSIDQWNRDLSKSDAYSGMARLAKELVDENCTGIFLPGENILMPNDGTAEQGLWLLIRGELFQ